MIQLLELFIESGVSIDNFGVTGSLLIDAEGEKSDIDLVVYDRQEFNKARKVIQQLMAKKGMSALNSEFWKDSFERRSCSLTYDEYVWHEKRKFNKAVFQGVKFDISLIMRAAHSDKKKYTKKAFIHFTTTVVDDLYSFDSPSVYSVDNATYDTIICFTPTYTGQAKIGDMIEVTGFVEESTDGACRRIIVGSSREASGEFIKVVR